MVGTDIADLLLKEHRSVWLPGKSPNEANLIDFNNEPLARAEEEPGAGPLSLLSDTFMTVPENVGKETERFRELLLFGRKKVRKSVSAYCISWKLCLEFVLGYRTQEPCILV